jgi:hypothetical protein
VIGAAMQAAPKAFDHDAGAQLEVADVHQRLRMNQAGPGERVVF